jgi:dCMP deaminase
MFDELNRPDWDSYFMALCFVISQRSIDPDTKHGCVVIDEDKTILSVGYNGPPRGCNDSAVPLKRPQKYDWLSHSEINAITNAARSGVSLKNSSFYITGYPCEKCIREIINVGANKVIYGPIKSRCVTAETLDVINRMLNGQNIEMINFENADVTLQIIKNTVSYFIKKTI